VPRSLKIALVGSSAGIQALRLLRKTPHEMALVLASKHAGGGAAGMSLWDVAAKADVPVMAESRVKDPALADELRARGIDLLLSVRTLYIVHPQVLDAPRIGAYNMHPGPLPAYGGRNVVSWAIFNGEPRHGVTVHRMAPEVDAGPIAFERSFPIEESDSAMAVTRKAVREGIPLLLELVRIAAEDPAAIPARPQDPSRRRVYGAEVPGNGHIDWSWPARKVHDLVRACDFHPFRSPWGIPVASLGGRAVQVAATSLTSNPARAQAGQARRAPDDAVEVACADEWLRIDKVVLDGEPRQATGAVLGLDAGHA